MGWEPGDIFTPTAGVAEAWSVIKGMVAAEMSANAIEKSLRAEGYKVQRQNLLMGVKALKYATGDPSGYIPEDITQRPNASMIPQAIREQNRAWRTTMWYDVYDYEKQDIYRKNVIIDEDELLTVDEYYLYTGQYANKYEFTNQELLDIGFESITFSASPRNR